MEGQRMIDTSTEFGQRVQRRLNDEIIGWLTTVTLGGQPQSVPIWFLWQADETLLIFSKADAPKLRHIRNNPHVSFNLDSDRRGGDIIRLEGAAEIVGTLVATEVPDFIEKYRDGFKRIGMTPDEFAATYSVAVTMKRAKVRGH
jgi:PPOX class probable F420-dependent enzyme